MVRLMQTYKTQDGNLIKVIGIWDEHYIVIDIGRKGSMPFVTTEAALSECECSEDMRTVINEDELAEWQQRERDRRWRIIAKIVESPLKWDKRKRSRLIMEVAKETGRSGQTVRNYLWLYWSHGGKNGLAPTMQQKQEECLSQDEKNIRWALNTYYYNTQKNTIIYAYKQMLLKKYTDENGVLNPSYPSIHQFRYFYKTHRKYINEIISRNGTTYYQRNARPIPGNAMQYAGSIGVFMTDATQADVYLVNRLTRRPMGRPNIYIMIDTFSQLVTGVHVGYESGKNAIRLLMIQTCQNKVEACRKHGIEIEPWQWPSHNLPTKIITDRGMEFMSSVSERNAIKRIVIVEEGCDIAKIKNAGFAYFCTVDSNFALKIIAKNDDEEAAWSDVPEA